MSCTLIAQLAEVDSIQLPTAHLFKMEHNVVWIRYGKCREEFSIQDARNHSDALYQLTRGIPADLIVDFREAEVSFSSEAREFFAKDPNHSELRKSKALIITGLAQKIVANFYLKFHRPNCPVQYFTDSESALKWILKLGT